MLNDGNSGQGDVGCSNSPIKLSSNFKNLNGVKDKLDVKLPNGYKDDTIQCAGCSNSNMGASKPKAKSKAKIKSKPKSSVSSQKKLLRTKKEKLLSEKNIALDSVMGIYLLRFPIGILEDFTYELMEMIDKKKLKQPLPEAPEPAEPNPEAIHADNSSNGSNMGNMHARKGKKGKKATSRKFSALIFSEKILLKLTEETTASCRMCYGAICPMSFVRYAAKNGYDTIKGIRELLERNR